MLTYTEYATHEEWLAGRKNGIGASEAGIVCGVTSFKSPLQLWEEKTGKVTPPDLSENDRVKYGTEAEAPLRTLFALRHIKEYRVDYYPYRIYSNDKTPYMTCTLDGELTRLSDGARGVWENKTALIMTARDADNWDGRVPQHYYCQICHQLAVTGWDFAILNAELRHDNGRVETREYYFDAHDEQTKNDMEYIAETERSYWLYIKFDKRPPATLTL